jgi:hypothetical protein
MSCTQKASQSNTYIGRKRKRPPIACYASGEKCIANPHNGFDPYPWHEQYNFDTQRDMNDKLHDAEASTEIVRIISQTKEQTEKETVRSPETILALLNGMKNRPIHRDRHCPFSHSCSLFQSFMATGVVAYPTQGEAEQDMASQLYCAFVIGDLVRFHAAAPLELAYLLELMNSKGLSVLNIIKHVLRHTGDKSVETLASGLFVCALLVGGRRLGIDYTQYDFIQIKSWDGTRLDYPRMFLQQVLTWVIQPPSWAFRGTYKKHQGREMVERCIRRFFHIIGPSALSFDCARNPKASCRLLAILCRSYVRCIFIACELQDANDNFPTFISCPTCHTEVIIPISQPPDRVPDTFSPCTHAIEAQWDFFTAWSATKQKECEKLKAEAQRVVTTIFLPNVIPEIVSLCCSFGNFFVPVFPVRLE